MTFFNHFLHIFSKFDYLYRVLSAHLDQKERKENLGYKDLQEQEVYWVQRDPKATLEHLDSLEILEIKDLQGLKVTQDNLEMMAMKVILDNPVIRVQEEILECKVLQEKM